LNLETIPSSITLLKEWVGDNDKVNCDEELKVISDCISTRLTLIRFSDNRDKIELWLKEIDIFSVGAVRFAWSEGYSISEEFEMFLVDMEHFGDEYIRNGKATYPFKEVVTRNIYDGIYSF
jgi:hypothetical protein